MDGPISEPVDIDPPITLEELASILAMALIPFAIAALVVWCS